MSLSTLNKFRAWLAGLAWGLVIIGAVGIGLFFYRYQNLFYPGVIVDGIDLNGLTYEQALAALPPETNVSEKTIRLQVGETALASTSAQLGLHRNYETALTTAFNYGKQGSPLRRFMTLIDLQLRPIHLNSSLSYDNAAVDDFIQTFTTQIDAPFIEPSARLKISGAKNSLAVDPGKPGRQAQHIPTKEKIFAEAGLAESLINVPVATIGAELSAEQLEAAVNRALQLVGKGMIINSTDSTIRINDQQLIQLLAFPEGYSATALTDLTNNWQKTIERPAQDAEFVYDRDTLVVTKFTPARDGLTLDTEETIERLETAVATLEKPDAPTSTQIELALKKSPPAKSLANTNDLGIVELIGFGESEYDHSIPSRIHNVALTTSRITNHIVKPGEEFSFNQAVGDVSAATGYQPAYVIMNGQTVLGDGGGVCQVSTTVFRAVLDAGLKITRRLPHSYRVSYYELNSKPGVDATVYSGNVDLRFVNDTNTAILIHAEADSKNLYMKVELYGTSDGRSTEIVDHITWDYRPAPAPVYIPDPTLPVGQTKQVDWAASGIKARFKNVIKDKNGNLVREDTYTSNYIPWSAKYLQGAGG